MTCYEYCGKYFKCYAFTSSLHHYVPFRLWNHSVRTSVGSDNVRFILWRELVGNRTVRRDGGSVVTSLKNGAPCYASTKPQIVWSPSNNIPLSKSWRMTSRSLQALVCISALRKRGFLMLNLA